MEFRRINGLPPYVFATINDLKAAARQDGRDVIDLGFGNPDLPSPDVAVEKLAEAGTQPAQPPVLGQPGHPEDPPGHRRPLPAQVRGRARPRHRGGDHHRGQGGPLPPDVGAGRPGRHRPGARRRPTPSTSTPRCSPGPTSATSASTLPAPTTGGSPGEAFFDNLMEAWESAWPKPRVVVLSFPHNPTTECVDLAWMTRLVEFAREHEIVLVHDFAYADIAFDGYTPPSILQVPGGQGRGRRAVHDDQVVLHGRLAGRLPGGQRRHRPGPDQAQELPRLRDVPAHPDRRHRGHERGARLPQV